MIGIIDYGMGNLFSVSQALERLQVDYFISEKESELKKADALILPGVGAFKDAMAILNETGLANMIRIMLGQESRFLESVWGCSYCLKKAKRTEFTLDCHFYPEESFVFRVKPKMGIPIKFPIWAGIVLNG